MLRSLKEVRGYRILAVDGPIGNVHDFFFDDTSWIVRYIIVDTGAWLPGRKVLLVPSAVEQPSWETRTLPVKMTKDQIKQSPDIDADKSVSRYHEIELHKYYNWVPYWSLPHQGIAPGIPPVARLVPIAGTVKPGKPPEGAAAADEEKVDPHLRSVKEVTGYHIQAADGGIGHVEEFIADDDNWVIRYMVIDTKNWLPGQKVLVPPSWIVSVSWEEAKVFINLPRETIKNSPEFNPGDPVNRQYEEKLYDYYGRPKYWT